MVLFIYNHSLNLIILYIIVQTMNTNPNAKRILCFGDSYTWWYIPNTWYERFAADKRWTGVLQNLLGNDYEVIEEWLNSRTLDSEDMRPGKGWRNWSLYIEPCLDSHDPLDLVVIMLGTNESKAIYEKSPNEILRVYEDKFVKIILNKKSQFRETSPKLLIISPPYVNESMSYAQARYQWSKEKLKIIADGYESIAKYHNCGFVRSSDFVSVWWDWVHLDEENNKILGEVLAKKIKEIV